MWSKPLILANALAWIDSIVRVELLTNKKAHAEFYTAWMNTTTWSFNCNLRFMT
jgi:hypothetical protein